MVHDGRRIDLARSFGGVDSLHKGTLAKKPNGTAPTNVQGKRKSTILQRRYYDDTPIAGKMLEQKFVTTSPSTRPRRVSPLLESL
jgi:hypothetical protein